MFYIVNFTFIAHLRQLVKLSVILRFICESNKLSSYFLFKLRVFNRLLATGTNKLYEFTFFLTNDDWILLHEGSCMAFILSMSWSFETSMSWSFETSMSWSFETSMSWSFKTSMS